MYHPWSLHRGLVLGLMLLGYSVGLTQVPPSLFMRDGRISAIDLTAGTVTINDLRYSLPPTVRVYTYDRSLKDPRALRTEARLQDRRALRIGMRIGYTVTGEGGGKRGELTEAWILPTESMPELDRSSTSAAPPATRATDTTQRPRSGQ